MPGTWSQILLHIVFSTKNRRELITPGIAGQLYPFIGGIVRDEGGTLLQIGGMPDHVHLLVRWKTDDTVANLVRNVKTRSSGWVRKGLDRRFAWQDGYGVFSVSQSVSATVKRYIAEQTKHHARRSFRDELAALLKKHGIDFEDQYLD